MNNKIPAPAAEIVNRILSAICALDEDSELLDVRFRDGKTAQYYATMFDLLITDPTVAIITSAETGELYFDPDYDNYIRRPCGREI